MIESSPEWKLDFTTTTGVKCYVKLASREVYHEIHENVDHPDYEYFQAPSNQDPESGYFLVFIRDGKMTDDIGLEEVGEIMEYTLRKDKGFTDALKNVTQ